MLVRIRVVTSRYRLNDYEFLIMGKWQRDMQLTQSAHIEPSQFSKHIAMAPQLVDADPLNADAAKFAQTPCAKSAYNMFIRFADLALEDDE